MQCKVSHMKTATTPSLRINPELIHAAESVLGEGETLSSFVEQSLQISIDHRRAQQACIARALAARDEAKRTGEYFTADEVLHELDGMHANAQSQAGESAIPPT
jgi:predicted transcriptional regulator